MDLYRTMKHSAPLRSSKRRLLKPSLSGGRSAVAFDEFAGWKGEASAPEKS